MQFPNALDGVKKIYSAEILALIGAILGIVAAIAALIGASAGGSGGLVSVLGAGVMVIAMAVLLFISFIMNIVGLNKARPDEENFKYALIAVIVGILASILLGAAKEGSFLKDLGETITRACSFVSTYFVCTALINLADRMGNGEMVQRGTNARKLLMIVWIIGIVLSVLGVGFNAAGTSTVLVMVAGVVALVASVMDIIAYILYLKLLSKARTMLGA